MDLQMRREMLRKLEQTGELGAFAGAASAGLLAAAAAAGGGLDPAPIWQLTLADVLVLAAAFGVSQGPSLRMAGVSRVATPRPRLKALLRETALACGVVAFGAIVLQGSPLLRSQGFLLFFGTSAVLLRLALRAGLHELLLRARRSGRNLRHVLVVGSGPRAARVVHAIHASPEHGYHVQGWADDDHAGGTAMPGRRLGNLEDVPKLLAEVDEVFVALPVRSQYDAMSHVILACEEQGIPVHLGGDFFTLAVARASAHALGRVPVITLFSSGNMRGRGHLFKRAFDRLAAALLLLLFAPLLLLISAAIWVTMGRPILFQQERVGYLRRPFRCSKFRTMVREADRYMPELEARNEMDGPVFKMRDDPRVTPLGRLLRKTSLDELPQILNVLRGEMSLVGPRPLPLRDVALFDRPSLNRRFSVWPGITCTWQISGRNETSFDEWIRLDMDYVDNWSLGRDLKILLRTIPAVFGRRGAF